MGNMDALWAFQQADMEVDKFEAALRATSEYKRFVKIRNYIEDQRHVLQRIGVAADERKHQISVVQQRCDLLQQRFDDGMRKFELVDKEDLVEVERFRKYFEQLHARLAQERREFTELVSNLEKDDARLSDMRIKLARARKEYDELQTFLDEHRAARKDEAEQARAKADELAKKVDPKLIDQYKKAKRSHSMPVAQALDNRCSGCNVEMPAVLVRKLKEDDEIVECENCGRMLFLSNA